MTMIPMDNFDLQYKMPGYTGGVPNDPNVKVYNHPRFGHISYPELQYLIENPTHGLHHYKAAMEAQREEEKKIQYEIQHGPGSYDQRGPGARTSSSSSMGAVNTTINYSGSTVSFGGDDYVKKSDVNSIVSRATSATAQKLSGSASYRLRAGL